MGVKGGGMTKRPGWQGSVQAPLLPAPREGIAAQEPREQSPALSQV